MATVRLRNINPLGRVDLPLVYRQGDEDGEGVGCLEAGEEFDVDAELAGHAPSGTPGEDGYDPGAGLLAQVGNYELVTPATKRRSKSASTAAKPPRKPRSKPTPPPAGEADTSQTTED